MSREFVGLPATLLVVVLNNEPETVCKIEFDREEQALVVYKISCLISNFFEGCSFDEFLWDVMFSSLVEG